MISHSSLQKEHSLQECNTLAIPSTAEYCAVISSEKELQHALEFSKNESLPITVLGGGSNVVLPDVVNGLVLLMKLKGISVEEESPQEIILSIAAGENWHDVVMHCVEQGWHGIENLALIPGTAGAAPIQNIGAYGVELCDCFEYLEAVYLDTGEYCRFDRSACEFSYRDSIFKQALKDKLIITRIVLRLSKEARFTLSYPALQDKLAADQTYSAQMPNIKRIAEAVIQIRQSKLPDPLYIPNAGSFFKNPIVSSNHYLGLKKQFPDLVAFPYGEQHYKLAAGWLIEHAGWKGRTIKGIAMHEKQALVLTNPDRKAAHQIMQFVEALKDDIQQRYQILLDVEPRVYCQH